MKTILITTCALSLVAYEAAANIITMSAEKGGAVPAGVNYVSFDDLTLGQMTQTASGPNGSVLVEFQGDAQAVQGMQQWVYHPPFLHNNQGAFFDSQPDGQDQTPYLTTGGGSVKLQFATPQKYMGLLWGTPDHGQALQLYSNATGFLGSISGTDLLNLGIVVITDDYRSVYLNINSELPFDYALATPSVFEFDNLAYFTENVSLPGQPITFASGDRAEVPDAGSTALLLGLAMAGMVVTYRNRRSLRPIRVA